MLEGNIGLFTGAVKSRATLFENYNQQNIQICPEAGLTPAQPKKGKVSGCSGMALAHSRRTSNHHRGDSFGTQCRYEPDPNILKKVTAFQEQGTNNHGGGR